MSHSATLFKYRTWSNSNHKKVLRENQLYYASPSLFNDPFDFKITYDYSLLDTDTKREQYVDYLLLEGRPDLRTDSIEFHKKKFHLIWLLNHDPMQLQDQFNTLHDKRINKHVGIISFSQRYDSVLMWSHYSENHRGFCVGYNTSELTKINQGTQGPVNYVDEYPALDPLGGDVEKEIKIKAHSKAFDWEYEKEFRLTRIWALSVPSNSDRTLTVPSGFIEEILLGIHINQNDKNEILQIAEERKIPVFQMTKKRNSFLLDKKKI